MVSQEDSTSNGMILRHAIDSIAIALNDGDDDFYHTGGDELPMYKAVGILYLKDSQPQADPTNHR